MTTVLRVQYAERKGEEGICGYIILKHQKWDEGLIQDSKKKGQEKSGRSDCMFEVALKFKKKKRKKRRREQGCVPLF